MILESVPPSRLLVVETERLSSDKTIYQMLSFATEASNGKSTSSVGRVETSMANITERKKHNARIQKLGVFGFLPTDYISSTIGAQVCSCIEDGLRTRSTETPWWCSPSQHQNDHSVEHIRGKPTNASFVNKTLAQAVSSSLPGCTCACSTHCCNCCVAAGQGCGGCG
jgi:hypothetical protein